VDVLVVLAIAVVALASRVVWFGDAAADADEQLYSLLGQQLLHGQMPYADLWDRKPLGLFALFALAHAIGGPAALAYQVLATLFAFAGGWLTYLLAQRLVDRITAAGLALTCPMLLYAYGSLSGQSEVFLVPLTLGMVLLVSRMDGPRREACAVGAMALGGLALQIKTTAAPQCLVLGLLVLWHFRHEGMARLALRALAYALLGLAPTLLVAALYAAQGQFGWFWYAMVSSNFARVAASGARLVPQHFGALAPLLALTLGGLYAAWRLKPPRDRGFYRLVCLWSVGVLAGVYLPNKVNLYYFAAFVPCALLLAAPLVDRASRLRWVPLALLLGAGVLLLNVPRHSQDTQVSRQSLARLSAAIRPHVSARGPCLLVIDGPTVLYRLSGSCLPSRVVYPDHWNDLLERNSMGLDRMAELRRVLAARPGAIVAADEPVAEQDEEVMALVAAELARHYRPDARGRIRSRVYQVWLRRE